MVSEVKIPMNILCSKWNDYFKSRDGMEQRSYFDEAVNFLLGCYFSASKTEQQSILGFRNPKEIANIVAQEFISCTYKLCADCDDDGQRFGNFLMEGQGMALLLLLELYAEQVTDCCPEMCNLLFSLLPLAFDRTIVEIEVSKNRTDMNLCEVVTSAKPIHTFREKLKYYLAGNYCSKGNIEDKPGSVVCNFSMSEVSVVCDMLKKEKFQKDDLLICLLSSLLGIISTDVIRNDHSIQYDIACKTIVLLTASDKEIRPSCAQQFRLILLLPLALIIDVIPTKLNDILSDNSVLDDLLNFASGLIHALSSAKVTLEKKSIIFHVRDIITGCYSLWYWQVMACRSSTKDVSSYYKKFASSEIFRVTDRFVRSLLHVLDGQSPGADGLDSAVDSCVEDVCCILSKIAKKLNKIPRKSLCSLSSETSQSTPNKRKQTASLRRVAVKRDQKSSTESEKESEKDRIEREMASGGSDSTVDMSDYVLGASDSDDAKPVQVKHRRNPSNASARSKEAEEHCYFGQIVTMFTSIYLECSEPRFTKSVLDVISEAGSCSCIDNDQLLMDLLRRLETQPTVIASRALDLAVHVIEKFSPELTNKLAKNRHGISRSRSSMKRREQSKNDASDLGMISLDVTDTSRESCQFLSRYKCLIESQNDSKLELLALHLSKITSVSSGPLQYEIFKKLILGVFAYHIHYFNRESNFESSSTPLIEKCLKLLPKFLIDDELFQVFAQRNGISYMEVFSRNNRLAPLVFDVLHQMSKRKTPRIISNMDGKSVRIFKDPSPKSKGGTKTSNELLMENISSNAIELLFSCGRRLISFTHEGPIALEDIEESIVWNSTSWKNFLTLLDIFNEMQMESLHFRERFSKENWHRVSFDALKKSLLVIKNSLKEKKENSGSQEKMVDASLQLCLPTLRTVLPICLSFCVHENESCNIGKIDDILAMFTESLMHEKVLESAYAKEVCCCLIRCGAKALSKPPSSQNRDLDQSRSPRRETGHDQDDDVSDTNMEEEGYDADTESDIESARLESLSGYGSIARHASYQHKLNLDASHYQSLAAEEIKIMFPDVITFVLHSINQILPDLLASKNFLSVQETLKCILGEIFCLIHSSWVNCSILSDKGLLKLVIELVGSLTKSKMDDFKGIELIAGRILVLLSTSKISADDFKDFLRLFKEEKPPLEYLSTLLYSIALGSNKTSGATFSLIFPVEPEEPLQSEKATAVQQTHTFLIPKREGSGKSRSILRQRAVTSNLPAGSGPKSFGYRCQAPSSELAPVQLPLEQPSNWPDMGFSIAVWFQIKDNSCLESLHQVTELGHNFSNVESSRPQSRTFAFKESLIGDDPTVFHICSFGGSNAMFEIWIGVNPRFVECRWLTTQSNENTSNFDHVILPTSVPFNKWNHLIVTIALPPNLPQPHSAKLHFPIEPLSVPSVPFNKWNHLIVTIALPPNLPQPHSAKVMTYINGCEQMPMSMKFPGRAVQKNVKLSMMLGHSIKTKKHMAEVDSNLEIHVGNVILFKGKESFGVQAKLNMNPKGSQRMDDSFIGNAEACYLYALGPDAFHLYHECGDQYPTRLSSHMDSSLTWDSIQFKEMSFAINILSQDLLSSDFPANFLVDIKSQVPLIQAALWDCVVLKYSPRRPYEFFQYISENVPATLSQAPAISSKPKDSFVNESCRQAVTSQAVISAKIRQYSRASLQKAVHDSGGIANLLFVFAKVSENEESELVQSLILASIFTIMEKSLYLIREMNDLAGYVLLHRVLESSPCKLGFHIVKALLNSMCDGALLSEPNEVQGGFLEIIPNSSAIVKNVLILQTLVLDWKIWSDAPLMVQELLWKALQSLVRSDHRWVSFNIIQFKRARVVDKLLSALQEREQHQNDVLPPTLSQLYISIIQSILGQPPDMPILKAICSFLIASHPTVNTVALHSQSNFYLTPKPPSILMRTSKSSLKPLKGYSRDDSHRSFSFTEGLIAEKESSTDTVIGIFSNLPSPDDGSGRNRNLFPKSEVLFRKEHKDMRKKQFENIDGRIFFGETSHVPSNMTPKVSSEQRKGLHSSDSFSRGNALDEPDGVIRSEFSRPILPGADREAKDIVYSIPTMHRNSASGGDVKLADEKLVSSKISVLRSHRRNFSLDVNVVMSSALSARLDSQEYDIISDSELPSSLDQGSDEYLVVDGIIGQTVGSFTLPTPDENIALDDPLFHVRLGLFEMLQDVLILLPDNLITRIFGTILKVEHLLVLVNQDNVKLREIAVKNLSLYLQRGGRDCVNNFKRFKGFHLLANQLHQYQSTVELASHCFNLMTDRLVSLKDASGCASSNLPLVDDLLFHLVTDLSLQSRNVAIDCPVAMVAYLSLLEDAVQHPAICNTVVKTFIEILSSSHTLILVAFEQFLPEIISNMICMLATADSGSLISRWKSSVFQDILDLILWIITKAVKTCEADVFQCFKDLLLTIQMLEAREREDKGNLSEAVVKSARFVQYFMVSSVLKLFKTIGIRASNRATTTTTAAHSPTTSRDEQESGITRRPSRAKALFNRLRSSMHATSAPLVVSPSEIQERYLWAVDEGIILATLFSKPAVVCEKMLFGKVLEKLSAVDHNEAANTNAKPETSPQDADYLFCSDLLSYMLNAICVCLDLKFEDMNWKMLLRGVKDELVAQTSRLLVYLLSPIRKLEMRFNAISQIMGVPDSKKMLSTLLHGISGLKNRERMLSCIGSCLKYTKDKLSPEHWKSKEEMRVLIKMLKADIINMSEQHLFQELRKIKTQRQKAILSQRKDSYKRKTDQTSYVENQVREQGMELSNTVIDEQDRQRQKLLQLVRGKVSKKMEVNKQWRRIISHLTEKRALWHENHEYCCQSWQLDPTEGPSRVRIRLQKCHNEIPPNFFMTSNKKSKLCQHGQALSYLFHERLNEEEPTYYTFKTNDTIRFHYHCHRVTPDAKTEGDVLIGETHMYFVGEEVIADQNVSQVSCGENNVISISWRYEEIKEILKRRYSLIDNAMEIFLTSGRTFLLAFELTKCRDDVYEQLISRELPNLVADSMDLDTLTDRWRDGLISNFDYLTELNKKAGRSFNDLMQYPIFPFILSDYEHNHLDLEDQASFRDLSKPIAVQHESKKENYMRTYNWLQEEYDLKLKEDPDEAIPPYHYGSHYSNSGTVLHFLVRLPPFTKMFLMYQDNQFDIPDRTFHSLSTAWHLASFASSSDVKEMIPEFFFLPEFLQNSEGYNFGCRQNGIRVHDVMLPPWTPNNDARLFVYIHRQALESHCVSSTLHNWIDLVFGYKQDGIAAKNAVNVFHPATYFGVDVNAAKDPLKRRALQTMIETYGQTPRKLFSMPHVQRFSKTPASPLSDMMTSLPQAVENLMNPSITRNRLYSKVDFQKSDGIQPLSTVTGLSWGRYCGSPSQSEPAMQWVETFRFKPSMIYPSSTSTAFVIDESCCIIIPDEYCLDEKRIGCLSWRTDDGFLVVKSLFSNRKTYFDASRPDKITCCSFVPGADLLFVGGSTGILTAWPVKFFPETSSLDIIGAKENLLGHSDSITSIFACRPYSIVVTGSKDSLVIVWDLNRLSYVRSLPKHESAISCLSVSRTSGNIATACDHGANGSFIHLWTINARGVWKTITESKVKCIDFSCAPEGVSVNVVAAGLENGIIRIWSTWTLMCIRDILPISGNSPVVCLSYSPWDPQHLFTCDCQGNVCFWTRKDLRLRPTYTAVRALVPSSSLGT